MSENNTENLNNLDNTPEEGPGLSSPEKNDSVSNRRKYVWVLASGIFVIVILVSLYLVGIFGGLFDNRDKVASKKPAEQRIEQPIVEEKGRLNFDMVKPAFAQYAAADTQVSPSLPQLKPKVDELENYQYFSEYVTKFSDEQMASLEEQGFFLTENARILSQKNGTDDFADTYDHFSGNSNKFLRQPDDTLFITSDVALHFYHILIDRSFQKIEETKFQPMLKAITEALFVDSLTNYNQADVSGIKDSYKRLAVYYLIPLVVLNAVGQEPEPLNPQDFETYAQYLEAEKEQKEKAGQEKLVFSLPSNNYQGHELSQEIFELAKSEIDLIYGAKGVNDSPLFTPYRPYFSNDYSQFKPRSHYTKNDILKSYFIAMMWYGRMAFSLDSPELTRDAIIITGQINSLSAGEDKIAELYSDMAAAIEFFVGEVDDLTPYQYSELIKKHYGNNLSENTLTNVDKLNGFIQAAIKELPLPRIVSEVVALYDDGGERDKLLKKLMQFRFMGQRFTPDAYVLNQMTQGVGTPDPETGQNLPTMTTALMPIYVVSGGNETVKSYINGWVAVKAPDSDLIIDKKLNELLGQFKAYDEAVWTQNIYWNWLNSYRSLLAGYGTGYPVFMTTPYWQKKNLGTVLGSYTELKHDTLLYAKQSYAELGGGGDMPDELPPVPKGYVEADPVFWSRICALAKMTVTGLTEKDLMPEVFDKRFARFAEQCEFFKGLVAKELNNEIISEDDFEKLRTSGDTFVWLASALPGEVLETKERRAGIIADIHTDAVNGEILYEATGKPYIIYVAVKDNNGTRLTRGAVFNHYEFTGPLFERYADEDWQAIVYEEEGELPETDTWSQELIR